MRKFVMVAGAALALACGSAFAAGGPALAAQAHSHGREAVHEIQLDHGRKWATDAPLREGMANIQARVAQARGSGRVELAGYAALADAIETHVASIVANCKLAPEADANLHVVVAELVAASDELRAQWPQPAAGLDRATRALETYGRYFDHPGWQPA